MGEAANITNTIVVADNCHKQKMADEHLASTLLHEIMHHIDFKHDIKIGHKKLRMLETGLFQVLRDNDLDFRRKR